LKHQLDGLHHCQSDLGKWSKASALFAASKSAWSARSTARTSGTETGVTWKPQALEMPQAARSMDINLFTTHLSGEQLLLISEINSPTNEVRQQMK
tara:strand:+ start:1000 stop:1287 length:288 start_codon:yes stop_codon:yes gene_type:complete